MKIRSRVS